MKPAFPWKVIAALTAVALCGAMIGAAVALNWQHKRQQVKVHERPGAETFLERIVRDLNLSPEQMKAIRPILDKGRTDLRAATVEAFARAEKIGRRLEDDIRPHLTPEQRSRLDQLSEKRKHLRERWQNGERLMPKVREWRRDPEAQAPDPAQPKTEKP